MLQRQPITKKTKDFQTVKELYLSAFPKSERAPMWFLLKRTNREGIEFYAYYDQEVFAGFSYTITQGDLTFLLYIAVNGNSRSKGYGAQMMNEIKNRYPNNRIVLNIEAEDEKAPNNEQRKKRKNFYVRNGYLSTEFSLKKGDDVFEVMCNNGTCTVAEFQWLFKNFLGPMLYPFHKPEIL